MRATGNFFSEREINGVDLFNLTLFRLIRPKAYISEVIAYIHNMNPAIDPYSPSQVSRAEDRLGLWLKVVHGKKLISGVSFSVEYAGEH